MIIYLSMRNYFTNYFNFKDRSTRAEFWYPLFILNFISFILYYIEFYFDLFNEEPVYVLMSFFNALTLIPYYSVFARRLHDVNRSGWWFWLFLTGIGMIPLLYWLTKDGDEGTNFYGTPSLIEKYYNHDF